MSNMKISNPKTEVSTGIALNDKDYITCLLTSLKDIEKNYVIAMSEASNEKLYNSFKDAFVVLADLQREVYELMFRKGWYSLEKVSKQKIDDKLNTMTKEYEELGLEA